MDDAAILWYYVVGSVALKPNKNTCFRRQCEKHDPEP